MTATDEYFKHHGPADKYLLFETKCRRCGRFHDWVFQHQTQKGEAYVKDYRRLTDCITEMLVTPSQQWCSHDLCNKLTIQDVVSYSPFIFENINGQ